MSAYDDDETWDDYETEALGARHPRSMIPSPEEIREGMRTVRWLRNNGFPERFVRSVMVYQHPRIDVVRRMVETRGAREAYRILKEFLIE